MKRSESIANRVREVLLNGRWIANTNYQLLLSDLNWQQAVQPVGDLNTIAALTFHVNYYLGGILQVLNGGALEIRDRYSFDLPPIQSEADWQQLIRTFFSNAEQFADKVTQMTDEQLDEVFVDEKYGTYLRNIEGMIEHSYYHMGQVTLIKKMILSQST
ncbi:MAG: DinB family protein [Bacteroidota bacterium]